MSDTGSYTARRIVMTGRVQGVGYRPFVYRLAHEHALVGHVRNLRGDVEVIVAGAPVTLDAFERELVTRAPPLAQPRVRTVAPCAALYLTKTVIGKLFDKYPGSTYELWLTPSVGNFRPDCQDLQVQR